MNYFTSRNIPNSGQADLAGILARTTWNFPIVDDFCRGFITRNEDVSMGLDGK